MWSSLTKRWKKPSQPWTRESNAVIEWAKTYRLAAEGKLKELRAKRNEEIESVLDYLDENAKYFRQVLDSINDAVQDEVSDHYVINLYSDFAENHKGKHATLSELKQSVPIPQRQGL